MMTAASPADPIFFLHHANIDRLWAAWIRLHPGAAPYLPVGGAATGHNLNDALIFSDAPPKPWAGTATPASVINHQALGYRYDDEWTLKVPQVPLSFVRVLYGVVNDAPGFVIGRDGKPHPVPGGPGDPWGRLSVGDRNELLGLAIHEISALLPAAEGRSIQAIVLPLIGKQVRKDMHIL